MTQNLGLSLVFDEAQDRQGLGLLWMDVEGI